MPCQNNNFRLKCPNSCSSSSIRFTYPRWCVVPIRFLSPVAGKRGPVHILPAFPKQNRIKFRFVTGSALPRIVRVYPPPPSILRLGSVFIMDSRSAPHSRHPFVLINERFDPARAVTKCAVPHPNDWQQRFLSRGVVPHPIRTDVEPLGHFFCRQKRLKFD